LLLLLLLPLSQDVDEGAVGGEGRGMMRGEWQRDEVDGWGDDSQFLSANESTSASCRSRATLASSATKRGESILLTDVDIGVGAPRTPWTRTRSTPKGQVEGKGTGKRKGKKI
jgi:hypothetical protein